VYVYLDHESMKRILTRVTTIGHSSMQRQVAFVYKVFKMSYHMALVGLGISKSSFAKGFQNFQINFPRTQTFGVKIIAIRPYLKHQLLR
jgi:hypothetical protein